MALDRIVNDEQLGLTMTFCGVPVGPFFVEKQLFRAAVDCAMGQFVRKGHPWMKYEDTSRFPHDDSLTIPCTSMKSILCFLVVLHFYS